MSGRKVLVLGDDTRSFLAIVRSLGRRGITIHAAPSNFRSPALRSRYIAAVHDIPPWIGDGHEWLQAIKELLRVEHYSLIIPCNETTLLPVQRYRAVLSQFTCLAIPDDRAIAILFDKNETRELARQVGAKIAAGRLAGPHETPEDVLAEFGAPVVVKPRFSYSFEKLAVRSKVNLVTDPTRLRGYLVQSASAEILLEEYFEGRGIGISILASNGRLLQAFEHHRVREIDGASFYRCSAPLTPELLQACKAMVAVLKYTGLAMFELLLKSGSF